jgi:RNA polymerase sigma-70 factor (ECF subfamily)
MTATTTDLIALDTALLNVVRAKAMSLAGTYGFSQSDRDDIGQELLLDSIVRLRKFDPAKSSRGCFVRRIVNNRVATLIEGQMAGRRDYRACRSSLSDPIDFGVGESVELGDTVSGDDYEGRMGRCALSSSERTELQIDVARLIAALPAELAAVAVVLKSAGVVEAGRRLGLSRSTLYRRLTPIRAAFAAAGLDAYLGRPQALSRSSCLERRGDHSGGAGRISTTSNPMQGTLRLGRKAP